MEQKEFLAILNNSERPSLLLHACCGPCSSYVLEYLNQHFDITLYFYNPNIYPADEYTFRANELIRLVQDMHLNINVVVESYNQDEFYNAIRGLEHSPEGGDRCKKCFGLRLTKAHQYAEANGFQYFTTTLSISPYKNSQVINEIGNSIEQVTGPKWLYSNYKKNNGYLRSIELSRQYNLYRQNYCGCVYSYNEMLLRTKGDSNGNN